MLSRSQFLLGSAAALTVPFAGTAAAGVRCPGVRNRGVVYEVADGGTAATGWTAARMRRDVRAIAGRLHANSILIEGDGVGRLGATAADAARRGLHVWLRPTLGDVPPAQILEHLAETGAYAERLRRDGAAVTLCVGCEFVLYVPGIVPGANALERVHNLLTGNFDPVAMQRKLTDFIAKAARTGRSVFHGALTYAAAQGDVVDWSQFDITGIDYYSYFADPGRYERELRAYRRFGQPLAVLEFGTCTYRGAAKTAGMGWDVIDYEQNPPRIKGHLVRSEGEQAAYLGSLYDVFDAMGLYAAMAYDFLSPDEPHRSQPAYDLDLGSYSITRTIWQHRDRPGDWHWEPKQAFHALAARYRAAACHRSGPRSRPRPRSGPR